MNKNEIGYKLKQVLLILKGEIALPLIPESQLAFLDNQALEARKNLLALQAEQVKAHQDFQNRFKKP